MDERVDVLDELGRRTGEVVWKSEAHRRGLWHRCFHCWVSQTAIDASGPCLLVQRRAPEKETWPGRLDVTAAGHLAAGEETLDGLRELEEELGLRVDPGRLIPLGTRRIEQEIPAGCDREFHEVFLLLDSTPPGELELQPGEVASILRVELGEAEGMRYGGSVPAEEWRDGERFSTRIRLTDFVPSEDEYLLKVSRAARRALAGERPGRVFSL
jgi:isopentenyldiphosphate isomerase